MGTLRGWRRRWATRDVLVRDGVLGALLTAAVHVELLLADGVEGSPLLQAAAFSVMTGAVAFRRRSPLAAPLLLGAGLAGQTVIGSAPVASGYVALFVVVYSVATFAASRRRATVGLLAVLAGVAVYPLTVDDVSVADEVVNAMIPSVVWALARLARERQDRAVSAERERVQSERDADGLRQEALRAERRRIARELHDTVAHGVTLMLVQSELLRGRADDDAVLDVVQDAGRACLDDLRRLLVVLREEESGAAAPGLEHLPLLVARAAAGGADVRLQGPPDAPLLPPAVGEAVFRVVQESLTNAVRHAGGSPVRVQWDVRDDVVRVRVDDEGRRTGPPAQRGGGHGLLGLTERVERLDGTLSAGPVGDGTGWRVEARLPLAPARVP